MSDCRRTAERLTPYVDEALPPAERADVEQHLDACPPCRVAAAQEQGGARRAARARATSSAPQPLPPGLRTRCEALAREHARRRVPAARGGRVSFPPASPSPSSSSPRVAIVTLATQRSNTLLAAQLTADHAKCFRAFAAGRHATSMRAARRSACRRRYGWDVHVPPSSPRDGVRLVGARRCLYARRARAARAVPTSNGQDAVALRARGRDAGRPADVDRVRPPVPHLVARARRRSCWFRRPRRAS